jgi:hypothetical protein
MKIIKNLWPLGIFTAFGLFFVGMASFVVVASTHRDYLVNENYYEQEIKFQNQIEGKALAVKSGAQINFDSAQSRITLALPPALLTQKFSGTIELYRPSAPKLDQQMAITPKPDGTQTLDVSKLASGLWLVRANWNAGGQAYFLEQKIKI